MNNLTITQALEKLKNKEITSVELTKACLEQIKKHDEKINAFITVDEAGALEQAKNADDLRAISSDLPLLGIPIAVKDNFLTKGLKTTAASKVLKNYIPQYDATVVAKLRNAGAVIIGKTNHDAWAHGSSGENSEFEKTLNPWSFEHVPGGSSSGSAASLSAGMALASTGTDTGGSIRLPASFTNLVGLKPTYGRVSRYGIISMASSLDSIGHFSRTVEDSALLLNVTAGKDEMDGTTLAKSVPDYLSNLKNGVNGIKIGVPKEFFELEIDDEIKKRTQEAILKLKELGAEILDIELPHTKDAIAVYYIIQPAEVSSNLARYDGIRYGNDRSNFGEEAKRRIMLGTFTLSAGYYDAYYKKAMKVRTLIKQDFEKSFEKVDAIISPVSPTAPWKIGEKVNDPLKMYLSDIFTVTANLAGIPGLSMPAGFTNDGLPVGIQILGPQFSEEKLFQIGHAYESATEFYKETPNL